jgi:glycerophosphoryl diester phosphodiesterase
VSKKPTKTPALKPQQINATTGVKEIADYATVYAPWKGLIVVTNGTAIERVNAAPIKAARALGMTYCVWTLRDEPRYLKPTAYKV